MSHSQVLLQRRRALRMTQGHLAAAASVSRSTVQRAERGHVISDENLRSMLAVLGLSVDDLADDAQPSPTEAPPDVDTASGPIWTRARERVEAVEVGIIALVFVTFAAIRGNPGWFEDLDGTAYFRVILAYLGLGTAGGILAGRVLWRRWRCPDADGLVFTARFRLGPLRARVPGMRWSRQGKPVRTWPGAACACAVLAALAFAGHYQGLGDMLIPHRPATAFDPANAPSGAWSVPLGSPLETAGLRVGDQVVAADGEPVLTRLDLVAAIRDHEGRTMALTVARPREPVNARSRPAPVTVDLAVEVGRDPVACTAGTPCGWAGDVDGLFSPGKLSLALGTQARMFAREVRTVGAMVLDPGLSAYAQVKAGHERSFRLWLDWLTFRMAAGLAVTVTMLIACIALVLHQSWVYLGRGSRVPAWASRTWAGPVPPTMHGHDGG